MRRKLVRYIQTGFFAGIVCVAGSACRTTGQEALALSSPVPSGPVCLRVEGLENPMGIGTATPRFGWAMQDSRRGAVQTAYQIQVADSKEDLASGSDLLWDSGKVMGDQSQWIPYAGTALDSRQRVCWQVRLWDQEGVSLTWSEPSAFETGILSMQEWSAKWIEHGDPVYPQDEPALTWASYAPEDGPRSNYEENKKDLLRLFPSVPYFRKEIEIRGEIQRARLYVSARGFVIPMINGERVGDRIMDPAYLPYDYHALYVTHDVTGLLQEGGNALGMVLGGGWHGVGEAHAISAVENRRHRSEAVIAELHVWTDQGEQVFVTDNSWKVSDGPIRKSVFFVGECYDAQKEAAGWTSPGFDDRIWQPAKIAAPGTPKFEPMLIEPERIMKTIRPVRKTSPYPGVWIYDFGEHFSGRTRLNLKNVPAGTIIVQRYAQWVGSQASHAWYPFADIKTKDRELPNNSNGAHAGTLRAEATYVYRSAGRPEENWAPEFDYSSLRYVEVIGYPGEPPLDLLTGEMIYSDAVQTGSVKTSDEFVNRVYRLLIDTSRHTLHGMLQDNNCQERQQTANAWPIHVIPFLTYETEWYQQQMKMLNGLQVNNWKGISHIIHDVKRNPPREGRNLSGVGDSAVNALMPYHLWLFYGDVQAVADHYPVTRAFIDTYEPLILSWDYTGWGDWSDVNLKPDGKRPCTPDWKFAAGVVFDKMRAGELKPDSSDSWPPHALNTPIGLSDGHFFASCLKKAAVMADVLGEKADASRYRELLSRVRKQMDERYYDAENKSYGSQAGNAYAAFENLQPEGDRQAVIDAIHEDFAIKHNGHLTTGWLGAYLPSIVSDGGYPDDALKVFTAKDYPSFGQLIDQFGLNMMAARWPMRADQPQTGRMIQGEKNGVGRWFYDSLGGIRPTEESPGFKKIVFMPSVPDGLDWAEISYRSFYGDMVSNWKKEKNAWIWDVTVPANTRAEIHLPLASGAQDVHESGTPVWQNGTAAKIVDGLIFIRNENRRAVFNAAAGTYRFSVQ